MTRVAALQMTSCADLARNLATAGRLLREARGRGAAIAALPENFAFMGTTRPTSSPSPRPTATARSRRALARLARELGLWIVARHGAAARAGRAARGGRLPRLRRRRAARGALRQDPPLRRGDPGPRGALPESASVRPGSEPVCVETPAGRLGLAVCYDLRFPELFRAPAWPRRRVVLPAVGLHRAHRPGALGDAAARAGHREPLPRRGPGAVRFPRERPRNPRRFPDRGLLGPGARAAAARQRGGRRPRSTSSGSARSGRISPALDHRRLADCEPHADRRFLPPCSRPAPGAASAATPSDPLDLARAGPAAPAGLDEDRVANVLGDVMGHAVDYADLYFQLIREESWTLEDGIVKDGAHSIDQGVGVRALAGREDRLRLFRRDRAAGAARGGRARRARSRARAATGALQAWHAPGRPRAVPAASTRSTTLGDTRQGRAARGDRPRGARARSARHAGDGEPRRRRTTRSWSLASDGTLAADVRPLVRLNVSVIVEQDGRREQGYAGGGGRFAYAEFLAPGAGVELVREAVRRRW